jgi:protein O-mannosyl-transferase
VKRLLNIFLKKRIASGLLLVATVGLVYVNSLGNGFQYDDRHSIVENPYIRSLGNIPVFFTQPELFSRDPDKGMYRPLVLLTLAINHAWTGYDVSSYHLVNIAIHGLCALLVWGILLELGNSPGWSLFGGMLFAVHPLGCEPVNYISSRSELLAALGVLGSFWFYLRGEREKGIGPLVGALVFFALGLLAKSVAMVLPGLLIIGDLSRGRLSLKRGKRYLPFVGIALLYLVTVRSFLAKAVFTAPVRSVGEQLGTQAKGIVFYLKLLLLPAGLSVDHAFNESDFWELVPMVAAGVPIFLLLFSWMGKGRKPLVFLGLAWMGLTLAPTLVVPLNVLVNEHRLYLPLAGFVMLLTGLGGEMEFRGKGWVASLSIVLLAGLSVQRNEVWANEYTLWEDAARKGPGLVRPQVFMGNFARTHGHPEKALEHFKKGLQLDPKNVAVRNNMANAYKDLGREQETTALYQSILEDHPEMGDVRYNLARAYQEFGNFRMAKLNYLAMAEESFHRDLALNNLGTMYEQEGRPDSALFYYKRALARNSEHLEARDNLERLLLQEWIKKIEKLWEGGAFPEAEAVCREVLREEEGHLYARFFLAVGLFYQGRYGESIEENQKVLGRYPDFDDGRLQLANALETIGQLNEAKGEYEVLLQRTRNPEMKQLAEQRLGNLLERIK